MKLYWLLPADGAHSKPATQSLTYANNVAGLAVDGDASTCSITDTTDGSIAWWQVDLQDLYTVISVTILASTGNVTSIFSLANNYKHSHIQRGRCCVILSLLFKLFSLTLFLDIL